MKSLLLALLAFLMHSAFAGTKKWRALALSGGGALGAYEGAVFMGLVNNLPLEDVTYDVVVGVSAGSLNTLGLSGYEPADAENAAEFLFALWNSIPQYKAFQMWPGGILEGLFFKSGIFDISPGIEWVTDQFGDRTVKKKVTMAAVDANMASYEEFDYNATYTQPPDLIQSAFASSSIPGVFEHIQRDGMTLMDGGTVYNINVEGAIRRCKEVVDDEKDIIVDMIMCSYHFLEEADVVKYSTLENLMRGKQVKAFYGGMDDYSISVSNHPEVTFRYIIGPSESIEVNMLGILDFSQKEIDLCYKVG